MGVVKIFVAQKLRAKRIVHEDRLWGDDRMAVRDCLSFEPLLHVTRVRNTGSGQLDDFSVEKKSFHSSSLAAIDQQKSRSVRAVRRSQNERGFCATNCGA